MARPPGADLRPPPGLSADGRHWHGLEVVGHGANRICVRDPGSPVHCLKYRLPGGRSARGRAPDNNQLELRGWQWLQARLGEVPAARIAHCEGLVETALGPALRCTLVAGVDGSPAPSLYAVLFGEARGRYPADALCAAVTDFEQWLRGHAIPLFDLNSGNLVVTGSGARPALVCIDTKSIVAGKELLPISRWSRHLMRAKLARRAGRLRQRILAYA